MLIELIVILKRIYSESKNKKVMQMIVNEKIHEPLQLLLASNDETMLKCVIELLQFMVEKEKKMHLFRNNFILEQLMKILDTYTDIEIVRRAVSLLTGLLKDPAIVETFKQKGLETLINLLDGITSEEIKGAFFVCFKLLSQIEFDLLVKMDKLGIVELMIDELESVKNPFCQMTLLQTLINMSMNDQISI